MSLQDLARLKRFNETRKLRLAASEVQEVSKKLGGLTLPVDCSNAAVPTAQVLSVSPLKPVVGFQILSGEIDHVFSLFPDDVDGF